MDRRKCKSCGEEFKKWVEFCSNCAEPMENYSRPAGFWVRVGAYIIDFLVFIPIVVLAFWNMFRLKSTFVLVLISLPGLVYKPFMESFWGATLGKMACRIKVIDDNGKKLSLAVAYARFLPFFVSGAITLVSQVILFSSPEFESVRSFVELGQAQEKGFLDALSTLVGIFIIIDCVVAAFTFRKRALHDILAESFCVYKEPGD
jgi:uncharacterized RDD family membrane protein YckC